MQYSSIYNTDWFGIPNDRRARMQELLEAKRDIIITAIKHAQIKGKDKAVVIFHYDDDPVDRCFITESQVVIDRVTKFFDRYPKEVIECKLTKRFNPKTQRYFITIV